MMRSFACFLIAPALFLASGCGDGATGPTGSVEIPLEPSPPDPTDPGPTDPEPPDPEPTDPACDVEYDGTFAAIQDVIFERHGCTQDVCHGSAASGGLELSPDVAYDNIYNAPATGSSFNYIEPGDKNRSYLWHKLAAATDPAALQDPISGSPMPVGLPAISDDDLWLVRAWILGGAPREGTVAGTEPFIDGCVPDPQPITIEPLPPPAPEEGVQFVLPPWNLEASSEYEGCFATYYDFSDVVPDEFKDESGDFFTYGGFELRQDPQSHHLLLYYSPLNLEPGGIDVTHESFGEWTCHGGDRAGETCAPKELGACGEDSVCASELVPSFACAGYGPPSPRPAVIVGGAGQAQASFPFADGVFQLFPIRGVMYWNTHAFNLTTTDHEMNGRVNFGYAVNRVHAAARISNFSAIFRPNNPPFTKETFCNDHVFPIGSRVFHLFAHTHKHGEHYWVTMPDGTQIYESFDYSDPVQQRYDPPLAFDSPDRADRTVTYCATFNNGLRDDGSFDTDLVTRQSRVPPIAAAIVGDCVPVACVNDGMVGEPCNGVDDDAACDTSPGAGDGFCDACNITGGESTENEMFVLFGAQYVDLTVPGSEPLDSLSP